MPGLSKEQWQGSTQWQVATVGSSEGGRARPGDGLFVTATSTEVGKTVVASVIARTLAEDGKRVAVFKPALTGMDEFPGYDEAAALAALGGGERRDAGDAAPAAGHRDEAPTSGDADPADGSAPAGPLSAAGLPDHATLRVAARSSQTDDEIAPYRFDPPMSPHLAAGLAGEEIDPERVMRAARAAADGVDAIVCEGVGGLLVPLSPSWMVRAFAVELGYPVVIVSPPGLGAINHTLLTVESARQVGLKVAAVVLNPWPADPSTIESDNRDTIAAQAGVEVLTLPQIDLARPDTWPPLRIP
jgi:dethiobiotin synthetase